MNIVPLAVVSLVVTSFSSSVKAQRLGPVTDIDAKPMGYDALYLMWSSSDEDILTGYNIYYREVRDGYFGPEELLQIKNPRHKRVKLTGLKPEMWYRITIRGVSGEEVGPASHLGVKTERRGREEHIPDQPSFQWINLFPTDSMARVRVTWMPGLLGNPGTDFYVKYKLKGGSTWKSTPREKEEDFIILKGLEPGALYQIKVVSVDGRYEKSSEVENVRTVDTVPDQPSFLWTNLLPTDSKARVRITRIPDLHSYPGTDFYVQYKFKGETTWKRTPRVIGDDLFIMTGLEPGVVYQMKVVSVDGRHEIPSEVKDVRTVDIDAEWPCEPILR